MSVLTHGVRRINVKTGITVDKMVRVDKVLTHIEEPKSSVWHNFKKSEENVLWAWTSLIVLIRLNACRTAPPSEVELPVGGSGKWIRRLVK